MYLILAMFFPGRGEGLRFFQANLLEKIREVLGRLERYLLGNRF